jgi:hypothetical protein
VPGKWVQREPEPPHEILWKTRVITALFAGHVIIAMAGSGLRASPW